MSPVFFSPIRILNSRQMSLAESIAEQGRAVRPADAQRHESLLGERADQVVQVRLGHDRLRRAQFAPAEARLQVDGSFLPVRRARQEHPQEQTDAPRSGRISRLGKMPTSAAPYGVSLMKKSAYIIPLLLFFFCIIVFIDRCQARRS